MEAATRLLSQFSFFFSPSGTPACHAQLHRRHKCTPTPAVPHAFMHAFLYELFLICA